MKIGTWIVRRIVVMVRYIVGKTSYDQEYPRNKKDMRKAETEEEKRKERKKKLVETLKQNAQKKDTTGSEQL
jgi:hypothetical protein